MADVGTLEAEACTGPFVYDGTASSRAGIDAVSRRLEGGAVVIIGLSGTGFVVLDLVSKTPVERIALSDGDQMELHNAFRSPGAMSLDDIAEGLSKVEYFERIHSRTHGGIAHRSRGANSVPTRAVDEIVIEALERQLFQRDRLCILLSGVLDGSSAANSERRSRLTV